MTRSPWLRAAHLSSLFALAVAQPVLDLLGRNGEFFVARRSQRADVLLFALLICLGPPVVFVCLEWVADRIHAGAARRLHLGLVAVLVAALALLALQRLVPGAGAIAIAALFGVGGAAAYARLPALQSLLSLLSISPLVVAAMFLRQPGVAGVLSPAGGGGAANVRVGHPCPVIFIVFDEFSGLSLMDEHLQLDAERYPHLGELARQATWFRNATTVNFRSEVAVPALLTGRYPERKKLQTFDEYPENIFTLLGGSFRLVNFETLTRLCPETLCGGGLPPPPLGERLKSLLADAAIVYGHVLLPKEQSAWLPRINDRWGDFDGGGDRAVRTSTQAMGAPGAGWRKAKGTPEPKVPTIRTVLDMNRADLFARFLDSIDGDAPTLYFLHIAVPHTDWRYLPSGRDYGTRGYTAMEGVNAAAGTWVEDEWMVTQGAQRYTLQVGYADLLVGKLSARLKERGIFDGSLIVLTADHGVSTMPGEPRRSLGAKGYPELLSVPLFVKLPGQTEGGISDRNVETIDVMPTIADALDVPIPWAVDGHSALDAAAPERPEKRFAKQVEDTATFSVFDKALPEKESNVRRLVDLFGTGATRPNGVWAIGPYRDLVGTAVPEDAPTLPGLSIAVDRSGWANIDLQGLVPARVTGSVRGVPQDPPVWVAIGANGRIAAVTRTVSSTSPTFSAMIPDDLLHQGRNELSAFLIRDEGGEVHLYRAG